MVRETVDSIAAAISPTRRDSPDQDQDTFIKTNARPGAEVSQTLIDVVGYTTTTTTQETPLECPLFVEDEKGNAVENPKCYAKKATLDVKRNNFHGEQVIKRESRYFIKIDANSMILDPWDFVTTSQKRSARARGIDVSGFKVVSENCFNMYVRFLTTRNTAWKAQADRYFREG